MTRSPNQSVAPKTPAADDSMVDTCPMEDVQLQAAYYARKDEAARLADEPRGVLEKLRTRQILRSVLPPSGVVYDIGGGAGVHGLWLAELGYDVTLFDLLAAHVGQALEAAEALDDNVGFRAEPADARSVPRGDASADAVLLLGPLYHLHDQGERLRCLSEAVRLLRPGGVLVAAGISRFAWLMDAYRQQVVDDDTGPGIAHSLRTGHSTATPTPGSFWAYFHRPEELQAEVKQAGLVSDRAVAVEGFAWLLGDLGEILDSDKRSADLLGHLATVEAEPSLLGASAHVVVVAHKTV